MHSDKRHCSCRGIFTLIAIYAVPALGGCGEARTTTPSGGELIPLPPEVTIPGEYFIGVHPDAKVDAAADPMGYVKDHIARLYGMTDGGSPDVSAIVACRNA